jgi:hypothetical protein
VPCCLLMLRCVGACGGNSKQTYSAVQSDVRNEVANGDLRRRRLLLLRGARPVNPPTHSQQPSRPSCFARGWRSSCFAGGGRSSCFARGCRRTAPLFARKRIRTIQSSAVRLVPFRGGFGWKLATSHVRISPCNLQPNQIPVAIALLSAIASGK